VKILSSSEMPPKCVLSAGGAGADVGVDAAADDDEGDDDDTDDDADVDSDAAPAVEHAALLVCFFVFRLLNESPGQNEGVSGACGSGERLGGRGTRKMKRERKRTRAKKKTIEIETMALFLYCLFRVAFSIQHALSRRKRKENVVDNAVKSKNRPKKTYPAACCSRETAARAERASIVNVRTKAKKLWNKKITL